MGTACQAAYHKVSAVSQSCLRQGCPCDQKPGFDYCCKTCAMGTACQAAYHKVSAGSPQMPMPVPPQKTGEIRFYDRSKPYFEFTNFDMRLIIIDGEQWPSTEHFFQAQKFYQ